MYVRVTFATFTWNELQIEIKLDAEMCLIQNWGREQKTQIRIKWKGKHSQSCRKTRKIEKMLIIMPKCQRTIYFNSFIFQGIQWKTWKIFPLFSSLRYSYKAEKWKKYSKFRSSCCEFNRTKINLFLAPSEIINASFPPVRFGFDCVNGTYFSWHRHNSTILLSVLCCNVSCSLFRKKKRQREMNLIMKWNRIKYKKFTHSYRRMGE